MTILALLGISTTSILPRKSCVLSRALMGSVPIKFLYVVSGGWGRKRGASHLMGLVIFFEGCDMCFGACLLGEI